MNGHAHRVRLVNPIGDDSRLHRLAKVAGWLIGVAALVAVLDLLGVDVAGWLSDLWRTIREVPPEYLLGAIVAQTAQTVLTAVAWLFVLRAAYRDAHVPFAPVLAAYAAGTALNGVLPAGLGTVAMLYLLLVVIPSSTISGLFAAAFVQKLAFAVLSGLVYVYLLGSVPGSFSIRLGRFRDHPVLIVVAAVIVVAVALGAGRALWPKLHRTWLRAKQGGAILGSPRAYLVRVGLPSLGAYTAKLLTSAIFLAAFAIPVTFGSILHVVGGNSIAGATAVTPGGAGVNEAVSVVALADYTDARTASAFSVEQHVVGTAWNIILALILMTAVFGWRNGEAMIKSASSAARARRAASRRPHPQQP